MMRCWGAQGWASLVGSALLIATWGCGSTSSNDTPSRSDGGSATGGGAAGGSATSGTAAGGNAAGGDATGGSPTAGNAAGGDGATASGGGNPGGRSLTFQTYDIAITGGATLMVVDTTPDPSNACTKLDRGSCSLTTCPTGVHPSDAVWDKKDVWFQGGEVVSATLDNLDATAGDWLQSKATLTLEASKNDNLASFGTLNSLVGNVELTVELSGGAMPAHRYARQMPLLLITTTATDSRSAGVDSIEYIHLSRQTDRVLEWQPGPPDVTYSVAQTLWQQLDGKWYSLRCDFDGALGTGTIPGELLANLPKNTDFRTLAEIRDSVEVEGGQYRFITFANTVDPTKKSAVELKLAD